VTIAVFKFFKMDSYVYQLGWMVGSKMAETLPCISVDMLQSKNVVEVSEEDKITHDDLFNYWRKVTQQHELKMKYFNESSLNKVNRNFNKLVELTERLHAKYLPKTHEFRILNIDIKDEDMEEFKQAVKDALWDCDFCNYNLDTLKIEINRYTDTLIECKICIDL
jgi:hypothetical protein